MTWEKPDKAELRQLNLAMLFKAVRLLLSSLAICAYVQFVIWLSHSGLDINYTFIASLLIVIYYYFYRHAIVFGRREALEDDVEEKTLYTFLWTFANAILLIPIFLFFAEIMGKARIVLTVLMSVLTFWREWFMLILFVLRKYTVKDGEVCSHRKKRKFNLAGAPGTKRGCWFSVVYVLDFEDACKREIPVMVDLFTYLRFKKNGDALLINYKYGDSYLFELIKAKKKASDPDLQDEAIEYKFETRADEETEHESEPKAANEPERSDKAIVTNLTQMWIVNKVSNTEMNSKVKDALVQIDFVKRYEELSGKYDPSKIPSENRLEYLDGEEVMSMIRDLGYTPKFDSKEKFYYIQDEQAGDYSFRVQLILQYGMADIIWVVKENGELLLGSPWGTYSRRIIDSSYRIKKPVFSTYDDLEDILKISFKMYEDFKAALTQ